MDKKATKAKVMSESEGKMPRFFCRIWSLSASIVCEKNRAFFKILAKKSTLNRILILFLKQKAENSK